MANQVETAAYAAVLLSRWHREMKMRMSERKIIILSTACFLFLTATLSFAANAEKWRQEKPCGHQLPKLTEAKLEGCLKAFCTELPSKARLCACLKSEETGETQISYEPKGGQKKQWSVVVTPPMSFGAESFRLDSADLNGDGREEVLFGVMEAQGNGMGVQQWKLRAIDDEKVTDEINVSDYGVMSYLTCNSKRKAAYLLASQWIWGWEPGRGEGLYIAGQWYESGCSGLYTVSDRPGIYHRYLNSLAEERGQQLDYEHAKPVLWHTKKGTHEIVGPYPFK